MWLWRNWKTDSRGYVDGIFSAIDSLAFYAKRAPKWLRDEKRSMHGPMSFLKKTK